MIKVCENFTPIAVVVFATFFLYVALVKLNTLERKLVFGILLVNVLVELFTAILLVSNKSYVPVYNYGFYFHNLLWLILLISILDWKKQKYIITFIYALVAMCDVILSDSTILNVKGFILGGLLYILLYVVAIYVKLKEEDLLFFYKNQFIIISVPIMLFFGLSITFAFDAQIRKIIIFRSYNLYDLIINFVNIIYYTLILVYIFKERRLSKWTLK